MKVPGKYRLLYRYYMIAADASGVLSFDKKHCDHCSEKKHKSGNVTYYHPVLEMKLITENGFALSIASEFNENPQGWDKDEEMKQDCELKAFYRHTKTKKLKAHFPRLPICMLLDGLYAGAPVFQICEDNGWKYIIVLKDDKLKTVYREFRSLLEITSENTRTVKDKDEQPMHIAGSMILNIRPVKPQKHVLSSSMFWIKSKRTLMDRNNIFDGLPIFR